MFVERQLKELQDAHKKAEYQSIKKIGESQEMHNALTYIQVSHHCSYVHADSTYTVATSHISQINRITW